MKRSVHTCWLILLASIGGHVFAADDGEADLPIFVPPTSPMDAYNEALESLERTVDDYFHAALRQRVAVSDQKLLELDAKLTAEAEQAAESELPQLLTIREMVIRAKLTLLGELDYRFTGGALPDDIEQLLAAHFHKRNAVIDSLIEGGAL